MGVSAYMARRFCSLAYAKRACSACVHPSAQQLRIRGMAGEPPRSHRCLRQNDRAARKQTGVLRLRGQGARSAYMRDKGTLARDYIRAHPGEFIRLSAERVARFWTGAGFAVNSGVVELHAVSTSLLGLAGLAALFKTATRGGGAVSAATASFSAALLHHACRISFPVGVGSAVDDFERLRGHRLGSYWQTTRGHDELAAPKGCYSGSIGPWSGRPRWR